ncbi:hypothetical protein Gohar_005156 [Gossypium harknessii]|uniref:Uncharacterized protein n=1 Tax=Gossypium harknessii TaxID=34285 RepID=A0A7J9H722_9ROSI|nr:hypothetical protein [Gossypium harknessii]
MRRFLPKFSLGKMRQQSDACHSLDWWRMKDSYGLATEQASIPFGVDKSVNTVAYKLATMGFTKGNTMFWVEEVPEDILEAGTMNSTLPSDRPVGLRARFVFSHEN